MLADVIAIVYFVTRFVADVIATVAVGIANLVGFMYLMWQMLLPCWLANVIAIVYVLLYCVADVVATMSGGIAIFVWLM